MNANTFQNAMAKAFEHNLSGEEFKMFSAILLNMNEFKACNKTNATLARFMGVSESSVSRLIRNLARRNLITVNLNVYKHLRSIKLVDERQRVYVPQVSINITSERAMSKEQLKFHRAFPRKAIDCEVPKNVNIDYVISMVQDSRLKDYDNVSLKSCVIKLYNELMKGNYRLDKYIPDKKQNFSTGRNYSAEEMNVWSDIENLSEELKSENPDDEE